MRELDLQIQNETDKLDGKVEGFFQQCKKQKNDWKNENFEAIRKVSNSFTLFGLTTDEPSPNSASSWLTLIFFSFSKRNIFSYLITPMTKYK